MRRPVELKQYAAGDYRDILQAAAIIQSMSRKGNCWDNAPMESFFGTLKTELVHHREYPDRDTARRDLFAYIEGYYNRRRIHSAIGYTTPSGRGEIRQSRCPLFPGEGQTPLTHIAAAHPRRDLIVRFRRSGSPGCAVINVSSGSNPADRLPLSE